VKIVSDCDHLSIDHLYFEVAKNLDPNTPPHMKSIGTLRSAAAGAIRRLPQQRQDEAWQVIDDIESTLFRQGYRLESYIYSYQEHRLAGSTITSVGGDKFARLSPICEKHPYIPLGLLQNQLPLADQSFTLEEIAKARLLARLIHIPRDWFLYLRGVKPLVPASLEQLSPDGQTIQDPHLLDTDLVKLPNPLHPKAPFCRNYCLLPDYDLYTCLRGEMSLPNI
jgi:hypothetical protein